ncbi:MAG: hypothetical protein ACRDHM_08510 [Actinomycetota bacterium]
MSDELDWGPRRPPAVSWAGALLLLLGLGQLGLVGTVLFLDADAFLAGKADRIVTASVLLLFALQALAAIGVLRLWRWWRGIAMLLVAAGIVLQGANLAGPPDRPIVVALNLGLAGLYVIVLLLLARSRSAFR